MTQMGAATPDQIVLPRSTDLRHIERMRLFAEDVAWRTVRKVDPIRNRALCKRRLDALRTEVARGNANEGAPDGRR
jgi:hypothetical protein